MEEKWCHHLQYSRPLIGSERSIPISHMVHANSEIMCSMEDNHVDVIRDIDSGSGDNNISSSQGSLVLITDWLSHSSSTWLIGQSGNDMSRLAFTQILFLFWFE